MYNFIKKIMGWQGKNIEDYEITCFGNHLVARDLSRKEIEQIENTINYCKEKKVPPISGYIFENEKGSYFCPSDTMAPGPMKIDCEERKPWGKLPEENAYSLKLGYAK